MIHENAVFSGDRNWTARRAYSNSMKSWRWPVPLLLLFAGAGCEHSTIAHAEPNGAASGEAKRSYEVTKTKEEWKKQLTPEQYHVLRESGTERAFTGKYWNNHEAGTYRCAGCNQELFTADTKFDSGSGWPSFYQPLKKELVEEIKDSSYGMVRTEVRCSRCGGHLGHVFDDGPKPTGLRYCINSASLDFTPAKSAGTVVTLPETPAKK
jgi:peptide-methionine (R)-S-oxide reductase